MNMKGRWGEEERGREGDVEKGGVGDLEMERKEKRGNGEINQFFKLHFSGCVIITTSMPITFSYSAKSRSYESLDK
jgi:hypothetical protein